MFEYILSLLTITVILVLLAQSYNLSFGLTGLLNLGHIIFYGIGAYTAAILNTKFGVGFFENLILAILITGGFATFFGLLCLRLSGHYLAIATLGAAMITSVVANNWMSLTNGPLGIRGIENPIVFGYHFDSALSIFSLYFIIVSFCLFLLYKIFHSPYGRILRAIKDDELAAISVGKNVFSAKIWSLILSASFTGIAGVLYAHYRLFLDPSIFALPEIIFAILIVVVGGRGNFWGCILSVLFLQFISEIPRFFGFPDEIVGATRNILFASLLIAVMFWKPNGLFDKQLKKTLEKNKK